MVWGKVYGHSELKTMLNPVNQFLGHCNSFADEITGIQISVD